MLWSTSITIIFSLTNLTNLLLHYYTKDIFYITIFKKNEKLNNPHFDINISLNQNCEITRQVRVQQIQSKEHRIYLTLSLFPRLCTVYYFYLYYTVATVERTIQRQRIDNKRVTSLISRVFTYISITTSISIGSS